MELERELYILLNKFSHYKKFFTRILKFCRFNGIQLNKTEINSGFRTWDSSLKLEVILNLLEHQLLVKKKLRSHILAGSEEGNEKVRSQPLAHLNGELYYAFKDMSGDVRVVRWRVDGNNEKCSILSRDKETLKTLIECLKDSKAVKSDSNGLNDIEQNKKILIERLEEIWKESKETKKSDAAILPTKILSVESLHPKLPQTTTLSNTNLHALAEELNNQPGSNHALVLSNSNSHPTFNHHGSPNNYSHPFNNHQFSASKNPFSPDNNQSLCASNNNLESDIDPSTTTSNPLTPTSTILFELPIIPLPSPILHPDSLYSCASPSSDEPDSDKADPPFTLGPNDVESDDDDIPACDEDKEYVNGAVSTKKTQLKKTRSKQKVAEAKAESVTAKEMQKQIKQGIVSYFKHQKPTYKKKQPNIQNNNNNKITNNNRRLNYNSKIHDSQVENVNRKNGSNGNYNVRKNINMGYDKNHHHFNTHPNNYQNNNNNNNNAQIMLHKKPKLSVRNSGTVALKRGKRNAGRGWNGVSSVIKNNNSILNNNGNNNNNNHSNYSNNNNYENNIYNIDNNNNKYNALSHNINAFSDVLPKYSDQTVESFKRNSQLLLKPVKHTWGHVYKVDEDDHKGSYESKYGKSSEKTNDLELEDYNDYDEEWEDEGGYLGDCGEYVNNEEEYEDDYEDCNDYEDYCVDGINYDAENNGEEYGECNGYYDDGDAVAEEDDHDDDCFVVELVE